MAEALSLIRPEVLSLEPVVHGSVSASELAAHGFAPGEVIDFSVNTNPLGPAPVVLRAILETDWSRYPGDDEAPLRHKLAERCGVHDDQVVLGNGSAELLWLIALAALRRGDQVGILAPTFGEYARAVRVVGAEPVCIGDMAAGRAYRALFVCNPNNPTGQYRGPDMVDGLLVDRPERLVILDEAYAPFVEDRWSSEALLDRGNLVVLRSMTKEHSLPGLRLGYLLAAPEVARAIEAVRPPWSVNSGALRAGLAVLEPEAEEHVLHARRLVSESRCLLTERLTRLGFYVQPSQANFVLAQVGDAAAFRRALLCDGLVVRDCASFGLPDCVRIACRMPEQSARLIEAIERLRHG